ncbi:hypothetical protein Naga_100484g6 [Nannochloropsis gaditana]|uniref:Uncharacterized protein n=1 Tax=Nannochloropsis gaditana TaxID=72520 RepID=W7TI57_9STRA|nr:hypothetical protein Naga_100484g6 [Nannochloropsis gaditana]
MRVDVRHVPRSSLPPSCLAREKMPPSLPPSLPTSLPSATGPRPPVQEEGKDEACSERALCEDGGREAGAEVEREGRKRRRAFEGLGTASGVGGGREGGRGRLRGGQMMSVGGPGKRGRGARWARGDRGRGRVLGEGGVERATGARVSAVQGGQAQYLGEQPQEDILRDWKQPSESSAPRSMHARGEARRNGEGSNGPGSNGPGSNGQGMWERERTSPF